MIVPNEKYILVRKLQEEKKEGIIQAAEVHDSFIYKGIIVRGDSERIGQTVIFAKYSPDTHEIEEEGEKMKLIYKDDVIAYEL